MNGYGYKSANDETENTLYIVCFTPVPYTLQEDMESDGNQFSYGDLIVNAIYIYILWTAKITILCWSV